MEKSQEEGKDDHEESHWTSQKCKDDENQHLLVCANCKRSVHYRCTRLPLYQIEQFVSKKVRKYTCVNCVKISYDLYEILIDYNPDQSFEVEELTQALKEINLTNNETETLNKSLRNKQKKLTKLMEDELESVVKHKQNIKMFEDEVAKCKDRIKKHADREKKLEVEVDNLKNFERK